MSDEPASPIFEDQEATTESAGQTVDDGKGRIFPCEGCGADLKFNIGVQQLKCPYCGYEKEIELSDDATIEEQDFHAALQRTSQNREHDSHQADSQNEVRCASCGATVVFVGSLTSGECPYCTSPIQLEDVHKAERRIPVDGVLPFLVPRELARNRLQSWVKSRWFAPNIFLKRRIDEKLNGVYLPYWTFDSLTFSHYSGQRGEDYYVTVGTGKNERRERRTRWYPASGSFQRFFDDILVTATEGLPQKLLLHLEPWPLGRCVPFNQEMLAGYLARTYETQLEPGFVEARRRIDEALHSDVCSRIGGDRQQVHSIDTRHDPITFKHLLLPTWLMAYRFHGKVYQVVINAATGEVQGERPYSWIKITLAVLLGLAVALGIGLAASQQ
jgi:DNA-directed RNA polymerase subunit RPC12/RpoP